MCLYPKLIKNKKYTPNKKNGGIIPPINDNRVLAVPVGCGKCIECRKQKARGWQTRLIEEIRTQNEKAHFVTLTFSNEYLEKIINKIKKKKEIKGYELDNQIATHATRKFLERWRKTHKKSVKHWFVTEIGGTRTERIHIHGILWTNQNKEEIIQKWKYGHVFIGEYVNEKTINYITKYVNKIDEKHKEYKSIILTSAGIGKNYINRPDAIKNKYNEKGTNETYTNRQGIKSNLPIYYRNKIYTDEEKEKLWIEKLNKEQRWICGEKIDISKNNVEYFKTLKFYREKNKRLGYGNASKDWEREKYEYQIRELKQTRIVAKSDCSSFLEVEKTSKNFEPQINGVNKWEIHRISPEDAF